MTKLELTNEQVDTLVSAYETLQVIFNNANAIYMKDLASMGGKDIAEKQGNICDSIRAMADFKAVIDDNLHQEYIRLAEIPENEITTTESNTLKLLTEHLS